MANEYYEHIVVGSAQEASIFANEYTWTILEVLRKAGPKGLTAEEVHNKVEKAIGTSVSRSKVYSLLKRLYEQEWTHKYYDNKAQAWRNTISLAWGGAYLSDDFYDAVISKTEKYLNKVLFPMFFDFVNKAKEELAKDLSTKKWLPQVGEDAHCKKCGISHEADEFFSALMYVACSEFLESDKFAEYFEKSKYSREEEES